MNDLSGYDQELFEEIRHLRQRNLELEQSRSEIEKVEQERHLLHRRLQAITEATRSIIRASDEIRMLEDVCRIIVEVGGYRLAWVGYALDDSAKTVKPVAHFGFEDGYLDTVNITWADTERGRGPTGTSIRTGKTIIAQDFLSYEGYGPWRSRALERGYAASIAVPLTLGETCLGALNVYAAEPHAFNADEARIMEELSQDLTFGIIALRDRMERRKMEEAISASLKEKEILLKEIHHRVKNNLQVMSSLLNLQTQYLSDPKAREVFKESIGRVKTMALIHDKLYRSENLSRIYFPAYVNDLVGDLINTYALGKGIELSLDVDPVSFDIDTAIPLGLIINELVSNALKHSFQRMVGGTINVNLKSESTGATLVVSDTGVGFPESLDFRNTSSLGMQLVVTLVEQLDGTIDLIRDKGTEFRIVFQAAE